MEGDTQCGGVTAEIKALFDANPPWKDESKGLQPDKLQEYMTESWSTDYCGWYSSAVGAFGGGKIWGRELTYFLGGNRVGRM
ncbi:hypothetical protein L211DRAFT_834277 [Terfezia boudieri ATCC MYA-4762]|uniref:Uncharacterized protein n=1 Tax=Terfezia boudieri ATCC MYA-4762 TaxID=1051890 RepID=A0A3N4M0P5_9PEZI|nr:hypothetical protein L211DRAFT_834277 [Terfezia boudieri ATCC MYA-4762]